MENKKRALIAMSGGVDSSVAALMMLEKGYACAGVTMKLYDNGDIGIDNGKTCCSLDDVEDARSVAAKLGIPYYVFNFTEDFRDKVISRFVEAYEHGLTPNPCIDCNRFLKFRRLYLRAAELGFDCIVTGHYAEIENRDGRYYLKKAADSSKDQSYVLYSLTQEELKHTVFPLGKMKKLDARAIAAKHGFLNAEKPDSQDICFVPDGDYAAAIERFSGKTFPHGDFVDSSGRVLGEHGGIIRYTVGQRRGLLPTLPEKMYVCRVCPENNTVVLGTEKDLLTTETFAAEVNWISGEAPTAPFVCAVKTRYRQKESPATVIPLSDGTVRIVFDVPQRAVTPGQAAVMYDGEYVIGGGTIIRHAEN